MLVMRASSDWRWLSALVTFCAFSVSSHRSGAPACSLRRAISAVRAIDVDDRADVAERRPQIRNLLRKIQFNHVAASLVRPNGRAPGTAAAPRPANMIGLVMSIEERPFSMRSVALAAFLPTLLFSTGEGAIIPIIPIAASNLGASLAIAGFISGMIMIGEVVGDVPSGWVVGRMGERKAMIWACADRDRRRADRLVAPNPWVLAFGIFLVGLATAVFALAAMRSSRATFRWHTARARSRRSAGFSVAACLSDR